jgi:predicted DNA-binding transcriptional regulator YafY
MSAGCFRTLLIHVPFPAPSAASGLRGRRLPITTPRLAETLEVSERTIYRDVADLIAQGAPIEGEAGVGYIARPGLFLPPLMLSEDEVER